MKVDIPNKPVESGGVVTSGEFRIKNSAKAFSILSSGLYSNKYQAILRELGCNAYDSHVEAGKADTPFVVHLPTRLNPEFYVQDFGVGLDHEGVTQIYTTYFESTKQDSNDFVGCMGLGSKSPFSYTANFAITAVRDGVQRHYTAFINEQGVPSIALMGETETDEPNGVKVAFAVTEGNDMYRFRNEAASVFKWFKTRPELRGDEVHIPELKFAEMDIIPGVHARDTESNYHNESYAMMGNVAYPIKLDELDEDEGDDAVLHNQIRNLYNKGALVVNFEIGDLDVAASREELSYIPHTVDSLYEKGKLIIEQLGTYIDKELDGAKTKWDRISRLNKLHKTNKHLFTPAIEAYIKKNPRKFFKHMEFNLYGLRTYVALRDFDKISHDLRVSYYRMETNYQNTNVTAKRGQNRHITVTENGKDEYINAWQLEPNTTVVFHDDKGGMLPRVKAAVLDGTLKNKSVMTFQVRAKDSDGNPIDKDAIFKKVKRLLGNPTPVMSSTLPKTSPAHMKRKGVTAFYFARKSGRGGYGRSDEWKLELETDLSELNKVKVNGKQKYVYYPLNHKSADLGNTTMCPDTFRNFLVRYDICKFLGIPIDNIYGLNKTTRKLIDKDNEWVNLFELFEAKFAKIDWNAAKDEARRHYIYETVIDGDLEFEKAPQAKLRKFKNVDTPFGKLVTLYYENKNKSGKAKLDYDALIRGAMSLAATPEAKEKLSKMIDSLKISNIDKDVQKLTGNVKKAYPMLKHLSLHGWSAERNWPDALDYMTLVDSVA